MRACQGALPTQRVLGSQVEIGRFLAEIALQHTEVGETEDAVARPAEGEQFQREVGDGAGLGWTHARMAACRLNLGKHAEASGLREGAIDELEAARDPGAAIVRREYGHGLATADLLADASAQRGERFSA